MEKVSVIIPLYNCEKFIRQTIGSVLSQTYTDWEMIVVDDASTDNSRQEVEKLAQKDSRIKLYSQEKNSGVGACRNLGISKASGRYLAFLDSDDIWSKLKLEQQVNFMQQNNLAASHTSFAFMSENGTVLNKGKVEVDRELDMKRYMKTTQIGMSSVMIDRKQIPDMRFPEERELCEDAKAWMTLFRKGIKFGGLNNILLLYRVRENQLSANKLHMAMNTLRRYMKEDNLPAYKRLYYFLNYACNGVMKRMNKTGLSKDIISNFNCKEL